MNVLTVIRAASKRAQMRKTADTNNQYRATVGPDYGVDDDDPKQPFGKRQQPYTVHETNRTMGGGMATPGEWAGMQNVQTEANRQNYRRSAAAEDADQATRMGIMAPVGNSMVDRNGKVVNQWFNGATKGERSQFIRKDPATITSRSLEAYKASNPHRYAAEKQLTIYDMPTWSHAQQVRQMERGLADAQRAVANGSGIITRKHSFNPYRQEQVDERFVYTPPAAGTYLARAGKQYKNYGVSNTPGADVDAAKTVTFNPVYNEQGLRKLTQADVLEDTEQRANHWLQYYKIGGEGQYNKVNEDTTKDIIDEMRGQLNDPTYHNEQQHTWQQAAVDMWKQDRRMQDLYRQATTRGAGLSTRIDFDQFVRSLMASVSQGYRTGVAPVMGRSARPVGI